MRRDLDALRQPFDVAVIGAGAIGAATARLAALSGLKVALIERGDFGGGVSHNSLKIVHGGLRYVQHLDLPRIRESVQSQRDWLRAAPHLVRPLRFVIPAYGHGTRGPLALGAGFAAFHLGAVGRNAGLPSSCVLPRSGIMSRRRLFEAHPQLERPGVTGGAYWSDGQILDANRLTFECVADAAGHGAVVANHVEATGLMRAGNGVGGVLARDELSGCEIEIPARLTINAAGPWALALLKGIGPTGTVDLGLHWTLNVNLVTARVIDGEEAIGVAGQRESDAVLGSSKRLYFITPWQDCSIIGTGHYPYTGDPDDAGAAATAIDDLLTEVDQALPELGLSRRDLRYVHLGLTPTEDEIKRSKRSLIVDHERLHGIGGLMTVVGIKYTTAPTVAQQVVAAVSKRLDTRLPAGVTFARLLPGAVGWSAAESWNRSRLDSTERATDRAWARRIYGALAEDMLASTDAASSDTLDHVFRCRILYGVRHEMVVRLGDAIFRASDLAERGQLTPARLEWCTGHLAAAHGWSTERRQWEIEAVHERLRRSCSAGW